MVFDDFFVPPIISGIFVAPNKSNNKITAVSKSEIADSEIKSPVIGIERHRLLTDGEGITTLVGFQGCSLRCKYCINKQCWEQKCATYYTPEQLYEEVKKDNLYFLYTHGGITFGGGEPGLYPDFIQTFKKACHPNWKIYMETSLNFSIESLQKLLPIIDCWIVDIKDLDETIYKEYTECSNVQVLSNLIYISEHGYTDKVQIRLPLIPAYNTNGDREISENRLREMGFANFDKFAYKTEVKATSLSNVNHHDINYGKAVCEVLKQARIGLAKEFSIKYEPHHCNHLQCKTGSCPVCEKELSWLESQIEKF